MAGPRRSRSHIRIKDNRKNLDELREKVKTARRKHVVTGLTHAAGGEVITYGISNEFGARIKGRQGTITTYRRVNGDGNLARNGRFVKRSKSNFSQVHSVTYKGHNIPARPFMRTYYDNNLDKIGKFAEQRFRDFLFKPGVSLDSVFSAIGLYVQNGIKNQIRTSKAWAVPNAPSTIKQKGSDKPLVDHGIMINNVTFDIRSGRL